MKRLLFGLPLISTATTVLAQTTTDSPEVSGAAVAGIFGVTCIFMLLGIAVWLGIAIWIMRDAKKRNSPNATLVTVLGFLVPLVGLIVHLVTRPKTIPGGPNP